MDLICKKYLIMTMLTQKHVQQTKMKTTAMQSLMANSAHGARATITDSTTSVILFLTPVCSLRRSLNAVIAPGTYIAFNS